MAPYETDLLDLITGSCRRHASSRPQRDAPCHRIAQLLCNDHKSLKGVKGGRRQGNNGKHQAHAQKSSEGNVSRQG